jgi:hypothetical protein
MTDDIEDDKPKGGGYALVDWRLARIEAQLGENAKAAVPIDIYNVNQQNITAEFARLRNDLNTAVTAQQKFATDIEQNQKDIAKSRKQFWLGIAGGVLIVVFEFVGNPISQAITTGLVGHK